MLKEGVGDGLSTGWGEDAAFDAEDFDVVCLVCGFEVGVDFILHGVDEDDAFIGDAGA